MNLPSTPRCHPVDPRASLPPWNPHTLLIVCDNNVRRRKATAPAAQATSEEPELPTMDPDVGPDEAEEPEEGLEDEEDEEDLVHAEDDEDGSVQEAEEELQQVQEPSAGVVARGRGRGRWRGRGQAAAVPVAAEGAAERLPSKYKWVDTWTTTSSLRVQS